MQNLTVALVQANQIWENKEQNLALFDKLFFSIENVDLIVLPEMFNTSFSINPSLLAEEMKNSSSLEWLRQKAQKKKCALYTSLIIKDNNNYFNRGVFVYPNGDIETYDKRKCFSLVNEGDYFKAGEKEKIVSFLNWNINLQICYDLRFPLNVTNSLNSNSKSKYDLLLYVANWPEKRIAHWDILLQSRAVENQCYVIGVNRTGTDGNNIKYSGGSVAIDPNGDKISVISDEEKIIIVEIKNDFLSNIREKLPFLKDH